MDRLPTWDDVNHYHRIGDEATRKLAAAEHALEKIAELVAPQWRSIEYDRNALIDDIRTILATLTETEEAP